MCKAVVKEKQAFERLEISKETLLKMFKVRNSSLHNLGSGTGLEIYGIKYGFTFVLHNNNDVIKILA